MSHQHHYSPPRDQLIDVIRTKQMPDGLKKVSLGMAVAGLGLFAFGAFTGESRAWQAFLMNWLFFTVIASAGVMFVAVQRIVTARWSRGIIRFLEGFVAFLPFAAVGLLLIIFFGKGHIYPWWEKVGTGYLIHEKEVYFNHGFFYLRSIGIFGALHALQIWYVYTSVRLDVGVTPEYGASWAAGIRAKMRAGFGEERRELHSTHSLQGKLAVIDGARLRLRLVRARLGPLDVAGLPLLQHDVRLAGLHGRLADGAHDPRRAAALVEGPVPRAA
jgi:hypothetical protein